MLLASSYFVRVLVAVSMGVFALDPFAVAHACSCMVATLEQEHAWADNVLIARVSGCAPERLDEEGFCRRHGWTLEPIEDLKGSSATVRVLPSDAELAVSSCDQALRVGDTYLLFLRAGRIEACAGTLNLSRNETIGEPGTPEVGARQIEVLRAYRDGAIDRVTSPWYFFDRGWECAIEHRLDGAILSFNYLHTWPADAIWVDGEKPPGAGPAPERALSFSLRPYPPYDFVGVPLLEVDGDPVALTSHPGIDPLPITFAATGDGVLDLLKKMRRPVEVVFSGARSQNDGTAEPFRATTHTALFGDAAARFEACRAAHIKPNGNGR
jgi:hypothetical protein